MPRGVAALTAPGQRLAQRPKARTLAIESETARKRIQPPNDVSPTMTELVASNDRRQRELTLATERLRVDHQPGLARGAQDVVRVQVLGEQHLRALRLTKKPVTFQGPGG